MTSLLQGAKNLVTKGTDIADRVDGLSEAATAAQGRVDNALVAEARAVADRAAGRLRLSADHTVVGIAGATGSGKSSTFNALTGLELSAVGVRRPTTSWATACVWGATGASELLEWLGIPERHQTTRDSMLETKREGNELDGVVLLDLPDHDSTEVAHHLEVDRLVSLADMLVWVLDPQKYADAAIHDRYLAPLHDHAEIMVVVLNHIDTVPMARREAMMGDVRRLLDQDGLTQVPVLAVSAKEGLGIAELKQEIARRVAKKKATRARLEADVRAAAARLQEASGQAAAPSLSEDRIEAMDDAIAQSAGIPTVVEAVERATQMRARRATGWPLVSWVSRLRPDPLKRLHLDLGGSGRDLVGTPRTSVPEATAVQRARVDSEVRALADDAGRDLAPAWQEAVRGASVSRIDALGDRLDAALGSTDLGVERLPGWAHVVRALQWLLIVCAVVGAVWSVTALLSGTLDEAGTPHLGGISLPLVLLVGGVLLGVVLALLCRLLVAGTARARAARADARLRARVHDVSQELVVTPVQAELAAYARMRQGLATALR